MRFRHIEIVRARFPFRSPVSGRAASALAGGIPTDLGAIDFSFGKTKIRAIVLGCRCNDPDPHGRTLPVLNSD
jgi:hypothetical protein